MLTVHQEEKKQEILTFISEKKRFIRLQGSAGVGKTWLLNDLISSLQPLLIGKGIIHCTAPTHNAVGVIQEKLGKRPNVVFCTTHSSLKAKRKIDYKTGKVSFAPSYDAKYPPLQGVNFLIVDEASMIPAYIFNAIEEHANKQGTTVIFVGDVKQLPPVGEKNSLVFEEVDSVSELTEIIRQGKDSPIIELSRNLDIIKSKTDLINENGEGYLFSNDREKVISTLAYVNGSKDLKYLAYTNAEVDAINRDVRQAIYGSPKKIELGESIIFNAPYGEDYVNNQEIKVESLVIKNVIFSFISKKSYNKKVADTFEHIELKVYCVNNKKVKVPVESDPNSWGAEEMKEVEEDNIYIIHEDSEEDYSNVVKYIQSLCKLAEIPWTAFYEFTEQFADINYSHALTIHKS